MTPATVDHIASSDPYLEELTRLFNIYRISNLNMRYYGIRAERYERRSKWLLIGAGLLSACALALLLTDAVTVPGARIAAIVSAAIATVLTSVSPFFGWAEKASELRNLHFSYGQVFGQIELRFPRFEELTVLPMSMLGFLAWLTRLS